jgi:VanZ family protein
MVESKKLINYLSWLIVVIWMIVIYHFSAQPVYDSRNLSTGVTEHIVETVKKVTPTLEINQDRFHHLLRKNAHFFIYLILAILVSNALKRSGIKGTRFLISTLGICVLYAISDEVHQLFVSGRGAEVKDVFIDSAGVMTGLILYVIVSKLKYRFLGTTKAQ